MTGQGYTLGHKFDPSLSTLPGEPERCAVCGAGPGHHTSAVDDTSRSSRSGVEGSGITHPSSAAVDLSMSCPRCGALMRWVTVNAGRERFTVFTCDGCGYRETEDGQ